MARTGISNTEINKAVNTIKNRGEAVTIRAVRAELGTGSLTTIANYLRGTPEEAATTSQSALPDGIASAINIEIEKRIAAVRKEYGSQLQNAQADIEIMSAEIERLTVLAEELEAEINKQKGSSEAIEKEKERLRLEVNALTTVEKVQARELATAKEQIKNALEKANQAERLAVELAEEKEKRHKAELHALEQAGLAQRMQDMAIEAKTMLENYKDSQKQSKPRISKSAPATKEAKTGADDRKTQSKIKPENRPEPGPLNAQDGEPA